MTQRTDSHPPRLSTQLRTLKSSRTNRNNTLAVWRRPPLSIQPSPRRSSNNNALMTVQQPRRARLTPPPLPSPPIAPMTDLLDQPINISPAMDVRMRPVTPYFEVPDSMPTASHVVKVWGRGGPRGMCLLPLLRSVQHVSPTSTHPYARCGVQSQCTWPLLLKRRVMVPGGSILRLVGEEASLLVSKVCAGVRAGKAALDSADQATGDDSLAIISLLMQ